MIRTLDFNALAAGTVVDDEYSDQGVKVSAVGGSNKAMIFDSSHPTGGDSDLATDNLGGVLIISEDGDSSDPDDNARGGSLSFDFDSPVQMKTITFLDIEETACMNFFDAQGNLLESQFVEPTDDNGQVTVQLFVSGTARFEVVLRGSGAIDNVTYDDKTPVGATDARDDTAETDEDTAVVIDVLANDTDPQSDPLTVTSATATNGTVDINPDGTLTFTPDHDYNGPASITYTIDDGNGNTDSANVAISVHPVNDAPVANDDTASTDQGTAVIIPVLANDTDVDGDPLTVNSATSPDGTVDISDDGTITFTPNDDSVGEAQIHYVVRDPGGLTDTGTVTVSVTADPVERDGYVDGTDGDDLIDTSYDGDPDGDFVDNNDEILDGEGPNDDIIRAGDGDDTVRAGEGDDDVFGGTGDDNIDGGVGDDILRGEEGNDTVTGGDGDDLIDTDGGDLAPDRGYPASPRDPLAFDPDADPENDRDSVDGGAGNDTIRTGDDRDTITGGAGDDVINAGIDDDEVQGDDGNDRIVGGEGNDNILGGAGDDTIYAGNDPDLGLDALDIPDEEIAGNIFTPDRRPDNGRDTVDGGAGNDVIFGADDDDLLMGGSGDDFLDGQIDDDTLIGGTGEDTLVGGQGDDSLSGGLGDDTLQGGIGNDTLRGNRDDDLLDGGDGDDLLDGGGQNDTLMGDAGDDTLMGATGDDSLDGGDGADSITGGAGDDTITGGAGADSLAGGGDRDTFLGGNAGDSVDGNETGIDFDTLDLRGAAPVGGRIEIEYEDNPENGTVFFYGPDNDTLPSGQLDFINIENVIPCFTPGTLIATPKGERKVEELQVGDRVITRDNGIQEIRWVGARAMTGAEFERATHLKPVLIRQGALGNDLPERDMMVSPNHRVLVANDKTALYFEEREVLVAAKHLTGLDGVDIVDVSGTTYIHVMFDQHEVILSDGTWTESFQPGGNSLAGIGNAQRNEILELFPELATREGIDGYASARRSLKKHEAKLLTK